jgi:uncharacterized membrane protein YhaH (DUF805 family)
LSDIVSSPSFVWRWDAAGFLLGAVGLCGLAIFLVIGLRPGTAGPNAYGPGPLGRQA